MKLRHLVASARFRARNTLRHAVANRRHVAGDGRFLVLRHPTRIDVAYEPAYLRWLEDNLPEVRARFELHLLPCRVRDWGRYALHLPWLQDPVEDWSDRAARRARRVEAECDRRGIPVVNRVDRLPNAAKLEGARRIGESGFRTARTIPIRDVAAFRAGCLGLDPPFIVREDWGHGRLIRLVETGDQLRSLDLSRYARPIAVEFIDVRSPGDGLVRKYRYVVAGDTSLPLSMHICESWRTRGKEHLLRSDLIEEESAYAARPVEHAVRFLRAREALGLDFVAFDYAFDRDGKPVVWEANPYPTVRLSTGRGAYRLPAAVRALAALTRLYLRAAGLPVPGKVDDILGHPAVYVEA